MNNAKTLFEKIWSEHIVERFHDGTTQLYIDRLYCHEVTSPQAFESLRERGLTPFRKERIICMPDHNIPTINQDKPIKEHSSRVQVETLQKNAEEFGLTHYGLTHPKNGIIHVAAPQFGYSLPGTTIVCGDSHTSTHGAMGAIAFGIGTSEVEMVLATQCILQQKPKTMRIVINGQLKNGVTAKDLILYIINKISTNGATGYFVEYSGETIENCSMDERFTICNMSIEMGARGGMIAPDKTTFDYIKGSEFAPKGENWNNAIEKWEQLKSDKDAIFDKELFFDAEKIDPMITFGTNPGMSISISDRTPLTNSFSINEQDSYIKALNYMGFSEGESLIGKKVDYVFLGSCTNGRIEDFRAFCSIIKGRKKADHITAWIVPGSWRVLEEIKNEGLDKIIIESGFELRQPGCSACLAMNDDKIPEGKYCISTSNRNFEGRQGSGARTILSGALIAAAAAITGVITDHREL